MKTVIYEKKHNLGYFTLNRPKQYNAINHQLLADLDEAITLAQNDQVRCLIITGAGEKAFAAGADISEMASMQPKDAQQYAQRGIAVLSRIESFPSPVIAMINGFALGGGCEIALACDLRIASTSAKFSMPETTLGIIPGFGGTQRLARMTGIGKAKELVFTGARIDAPEALGIGLVNHVLPDNELKDFTEKLALKIAENAPIALREAKKAMSTFCPKEQDFETEISHFSHCFKTEDQKEAMNAFLENRSHEPFQNK